MKPNCIYRLEPADPHSDYARALLAHGKIETVRGDRGCWAVEISPAANGITIALQSGGIPSSVRLGSMWEQHLRKRRDLVAALDAPVEAPPGMEETVRTGRRFTLDEQRRDCAGKLVQAFAEKGLVIEERTAENLFGYLAEIAMPKQPQKSPQRG